MCFNRREKPAKIVTGLSVLVLICGIVMLINCIIFAGDKDAFFNEDEQWEEDQGLAMGGVISSLIIFSILAIFVGCAGMCCSCKPCAEGGLCWPIVYGTCMTFIWVVFMVVGCVIASVSIAGPQQLETFCADGTVDTEKEAQFGYLRDAINEIDYQINGYSTVYMCSSECPCATEEIGAWLALDEATLNSYDRTKVQVTGSSPTAEEQF